MNFHIDKIILKKVSIWSILIYSVARTFKSDTIKNKLWKTLPGLKKPNIRYWCKNLKRQQYFNCLNFGNILLNLKMLLTNFTNYTNFENLYSMSLSSHAPSHLNSDSSKTSLSLTSSEPWYLLWTPFSNFFHKIFEGVALKLF